MAHVRLQLVRADAAHVYPRTPNSHDDRARRTDRNRASGRDARSRTAACAARASLKSFCHVYWRFSESKRLVVDAVLFDVRAVLSLRDVKCVVQRSVSLPFANTDAERTRSCDSLRSVGTPYASSKLLMPFDCKKRTPRVPLVAELVAQRRRDALVQIAVRVRIGVRRDVRIDRREAVGLLARDGHAEGRAAVLVERAVHAACCAACDSCRTRPRS